MFPNPNPWAQQGAEANPFAAGGAAAGAGGGAAPPAGPAFVPGPGLFAGVQPAQYNPVNIRAAGAMRANQRGNQHWRMVGFNPAGFGAGQMPMHQGPLFGLQGVQPYNPGAVPVFQIAPPAAAAAAPAAAAAAFAVGDIYAGRPHLGSKALPAGYSELLSGDDPIPAGTEMVDFHGELGNKRVYTLESFRQMVPFAGRKVNPFTRRPIDAANVTYYRVGAAPMEMNGGRKRRRCTMKRNKRHSRRRR